MQALILLALGYFVDFFDLTLFAAARANILQSFNISADNVLPVSRMMFNWQAIGIVCGGLIAGIWGDKIGRMSSVRFGIFIYSTAILWSAFTTSVDFFIFLRFMAGLGLAGELASSVTFVTEVAQGKRRDLATSTIYFSGVLGGITATILSAFVDWKTLFIIGAISGYSLLFFRMSIKDPLLFYEVKKNSSVKRGSLKMLFFKKDSLVRVLALTALLVPFWFMVYFINFAPEVAKQIGIKGTVSQSLTLSCFFIGSLLGTYFFAYIARLLQSRKKTLLIVFVIMLIAITGFAFGSLLNLLLFYTLMLILGIACGYPGMYTTLAAESFGTNQRTTGTAVVSCFGRGSLVLINTFVPWMTTISGSTLGGILASNLFVFVLSLFALSLLKETHSAPVDYVES